MKDQLGKLLGKRLFLHPIYIVGMGRSGTTVLLEALGKHPLILTASGEAILIYRIGELAYLFTEFHDRKIYYRNNLKVPREYLYESFRRLCFESIMGPTYGLKVFIKGLIIHRDLSILRKRYWCAKTFPTLEAYRGLMQLYPEAKLIYVIRNGINVVHSRTEISGDNFRGYCEKWVENTERYRYLSNLASALEVRHEQLIAEPELFFRKIFDFINVDYHHAPIDFVKNTLVHPLDEPTQVGVDVMKILSTREPPYQSWSKKRREMFKKICGDAMGEMGYEIPF